MARVTAAPIRWFHPLAILVLLGASHAWAAPPVCTATSATYANPNGVDIVFTFDCGAQTCEAGAFANGDCWVVAPSGGLSVTRIDPPLTTTCGPASDQTCDGWEINPFGGDQAFDSRLVSFSSALTPPPANPSPTTPYMATAGQSLVKVVSDDPGGPGYPCYEVGGKSCIQFAAVLTVLDSAPAVPNQTFRPPPYGSDKPIHSTTMLRTDLLSSLPAPASFISTATALSYLEFFPFEYSTSSINNDRMPSDVNYGVARSLPWRGDAVLGDVEIMLYLNSDADNVSGKMPVLIAQVQRGIDIYAAYRAGGSLLRGSGGNGVGLYLSAMFAATMLQDSSILSTLQAVAVDDFFDTDSYKMHVTGSTGLWAQSSWSATPESFYWDEVELHLRTGDCSSRTTLDPYAYIDGGCLPGTSYQNNTNRGGKAVALMLHVMPALRQYWLDHGDPIVAYMDRMIADGAQVTPDPCAPVRGTCDVGGAVCGTDMTTGPSNNGGCATGGCIPTPSGRGTLWGPDPSSPGNCIPGSGRFLAMAGYGAGTGSEFSNRASPIIDEAWVAFRDCGETCSCVGQSPQCQVAPAAPTGLSVF